MNKLRDLTGHQKQDTQREHQQHMMPGSRVKSAPRSQPTPAVRNP